MKIGKNSSNKGNCPTNFKKYTTSYHYTLLLLFSGQLCPILCDPMDCSTPGHPAPHHLPEFAQVLGHCIGDAVKPSHPLMPSSSALNLFQHQGFSNEFSVLIRWWRYWSFSFSIQWIFRVDFPQDWLVWTPCCPWDFQEPPSAPQFKSINSLVSCLLSALTTVCDQPWIENIKIPQSSKK